jgi:hypothetical protein
MLGKASEKAEMEEIVCDVEGHGKFIRSRILAPTAD